MKGFDNISMLKTTQTMNKKKYENLEDCFYQLQNDYNCALMEIKELKETIEILKSICQTHHIEIPSNRDFNLF